MRIAITTHYGLPHVGGIETAVDGLCDALRSRGHEVVHLTSDLPSVATDPSVSASGTDMVRIPAWGRLEAMHVPWPLFGRTLAHELDRLWTWADVVHAHGILYHPTIAAARRRRRRAGTGLVITEHVGHVAYDHPVIDAVEKVAIAAIGRRTVGAADSLVALNDRVAGELVRLGWRRQVPVIANGIDTERFAPSSPAERAAERAALGWDDRPRVLFVGRLVEKKGLSTVLALAARRGAGSQVLLIGPGAAPVASGEALVLGSQDRSVVAAHMRAADVLVLPSRGEGFPVVAQEALACGLPVVLSDDPTYADIAGAARGGFRVADGIDGFDAAIDAVLAEGESSRLDARRLATERFSWSASCAAYEGCYEAAADASRSKP
jgi:D-inositol-3-phosphate glycosyltransferase